MRSRFCALLLSILLVSLLFVPAAAAAPARTEPMAHWGSLNLRMPSRHVVEVRFHQAHPRKRVVVLHTVSPRVEPGDRVRAGRTVIASRSRELPFGSQIDRYSGRRLPHVHIEVRRY